MVKHIWMLNVADYRRRLAIVHQEVDVFNGTMLDNLTYGNRKASFEQVPRSLSDLVSDEVIQHLPRYYTVVVNGVCGCLRAAAAIGNCAIVLVEPDVLIFDEATSSLDYESERSIQLAIFLGIRTTINHHRLSTVREADKIVVLDQGRIVEVGSHAELLRQ